MLTRVLIKRLISITAAIVLLMLLLFIVCIQIHSTIEVKVKNSVAETTNTSNEEYKEEKSDLMDLLLMYLWNNGMNCFRVRLFVNPEVFDDQGIFTGNNLSYTLYLLRDVKFMFPNATLIVDLHYSDTWADPSYQSKPREWRNLSYNELVSKIYWYSRSVMEKLVEHGIVPDLVQVGNEITWGFSGLMEKSAIYQMLKSNGPSLQIN